MCRKLIFGAAVHCTDLQDVFTAALSTFPMLGWAGLGWAGLELCRAEDVPSPSVYTQAVRASGTEKGVPRSYLQT